MCVCKELDLPVGKEEEDDSRDLTVERVKYQSFWIRYTLSGTHRYRKNHIISQSGGKNE